MKSFCYEMNIPIIFASVGATLSTVSNIPQVWKVRKLHSTDDFHSYSIVMHLIAAFTWSAYGFMLELYILGVESAIVMVMYILILMAILRDRWWCPPKSDMPV